MRHLKVGRKFGRESHQRVALLRSLCSSLVKYESIKTTLHKAKDLRKVIEKAVTMAKAEGAGKKNELRAMFHSGNDRELIGRDNIKKYLSNLDKDSREKAEKYLEDPAKNPKPAFIVEFLPSNREIKKDKKPNPKTGAVRPNNAPLILRIEGILSKLVNRLAPRFKDVPGGYTRIYKLGPRHGDSAEMAIIEFTKKE